jgi:HK97 gp10 family phage protein
MSDILKVKFDSTKLLAALAKCPQEVTKALRTNMKQAMRDLAYTASKSDNHKYKSKSGMLSRSITYSVSSDGLKGKVFLDTGTAPYSVWQHEGTRDHKVNPKTAKSLYWVKGGGKQFSKGHVVSGIKPDRFLPRALNKMRAEIVEKMSDGYHKALKAAGF